MGIETLALGSLLGSGLSTAIGAGGAVLSGIAGYQNANYQAAVASNNAELARRQAELASFKGQTDAYRQDLKNRAILGEQNAAMGASGFDLGSSSFGRVRGSTAELGRFDTLNTMHASDMEKYGYQIQQSNFLSEAKAKKQAGINSLISGAIGATGSLIGGASQVADKWLTYSTKGIDPFKSFRTGGSSPISAFGLY